MGTVADFQTIRDRAQWFAQDPAGYMRHIREHAGPNAAESSRRDAAEAAFWLEMEDRGLSIGTLPEDQQRRLHDIWRGVDEPHVKAEVQQAAEWFEHFAEEATE